MTWTRLGSEFLTDPDIQSVARGPRHLLVESTIWSNQHGTDGHIPRHMIGRITDEPDAVGAAGQLVGAGLWLATETGWDIVGFLDEQPSASDVERTAALTRDRQRRQRQHRNGDHSLCDPRYCNASKTAEAKDGVTRDTTRASGVSHDPRTVPIRAVKAKDRDGVETDAPLRSAPVSPKDKPKVNPSEPQGNTRKERTHNFAPRWIGVTGHGELYGITVEANDIGDDAHHEITVSAVTYLAVEGDTADQYGDVEPHELASIAQHVAGMLGRLATWAAPYVEEQRQEHGCSTYVRRYSGPEARPSTGGECCGVNCFEELLTPSRSYREPPAVWITVPTAQADHWLDLVHGWLDDLASEQALTVAPADASGVSVVTPIRLAPPLLAVDVAGGCFDCPPSAWLANGDRDTTTPCHGCGYGMADGEVAL